MCKRLTEEEEQLLYRFETVFGRISSAAALNAAIEAEAAKRKVPTLHAQYALQQIALERYAELREKEENLLKFFVREPGEVSHFTQFKEKDHA